MQMEAKEAGLDNGVFIDDDGHVGESSNMNVAFVTADGVLRHPKFDHILAGLHLAAAAGTGARAPGQRAADRRRGVRHPRRRRTRRARDAAARQLGQGRAHRRSGTVSRLATARPGPVARALLDLLEEDMRTSDRLIDVAYRSKGGALIFRLKPEAKRALCGGDFLAGN